MTRRMLNHQSLLIMILGAVMVMNLLKCSDGGSPGYDTQLHIASGQGEP